MTVHKKCPKCGIIGDDESRFCRSCGSPLIDSTRQDEIPDEGGARQTLEHASQVLEKVTSTVSKVESTLNTVVKIGSAADQVSQFIVRPPAEWQVVVGDMLPVAGQRMAEAAVSSAGQQIQRKVTEEITKKLEEKLVTPVPAETPPPVIIEPVPSPLEEDAGEFCPACNTPLKTGAKFCNKCGASVTERQSSRTDMQICQACQSPLAPGAKFCPKCGSKTGSSVTPVPGSAVQKTCSSCGSILKDGAKFCKKCGARV